MTIIQQPDALSLSRNIKSFRIGSDTEFSFVLKQGTEEILSQTYDPGIGGVAEIDLRDIVHSRLSFDFKDATTPYQQSQLASTFTAIIDSTQVTSAWFVAVWTDWPTVPPTSSPKTSLLGSPR